MSSVNIDRNATLDGVRKMWSEFLRSTPHDVLQHHCDPATLQLSWAMAKTNAPLDNNAFLERYNDARKRIIDALISVAFIQSAYLHDDDVCGTCTAISVGSTALTSDYDVSVFGPQSPTIVEQFYRLFRSVFRGEPGNVFDTNVYGGPNFFRLWPRATFAQLPPIKPLKMIYTLIEKTLSGDKNVKVAMRTYSLPKRNSVLTTLQRMPYEPQTRFCIGASSKTSDSCIWNPTKLCSSDRCWAYIAFFRFMDDEEGGKNAALFTDALLREAPPATHDLKNYLALHKQLESDRRKITKKTYLETCQLATSGISGEKTTKQCRETNYYLELIERSQNAQHRFYKSINAQKSRETQVALKDVLRYSISHSAMYGSEMYVTSGAVLHVVVATQMKIDPQNFLLRDDLFASFLENAGYAYHVFESAEATHVDKRFCIDTLIRGSKYMSRMLNAQLRFCKRFDKSDISKRAALQRAYTAAEDARKNARNRLHQLSDDDAQRYFMHIATASGFAPDTKRCNKQAFIKQYLRWLVQQVAYFYKFLL